MIDKREKRNMGDEGFINLDPVTSRDPNQFTLLLHSMSTHVQDDPHDDTLSQFQALLDSSRHASSSTVDLAKLRSLCSNGGFIGSSSPHSF